MIGNDIIDLELAKTESNWKRKGFLDKIFTKSEQKLILSSKTPELMVWVVWSCKEAAYKIYNRATLIRAFIPLQLECDLEFHTGQIFGKVKCYDNNFFIRTEVTQDYIYTIAVTNLDSFKDIKKFDKDLKIIKKNGIPYFNEGRNFVSITHHGRFERRIFI